jgi:hypothetical protein
MDAYSTNFNSPLVRAQKAVSDYVHSLNKKFLWIPYYWGDSENIKKVGRIINRTSIFDYAILQPGYYFYKSGRFYFPFNTLKKMVSEQRCYDPNGTTISGGSKISTTEIGIEMEVDSYIASASSYLSRYNEYETAFRSFVGNRPLAYYGGNTESLMHNTVFSKIKNFYA